MKQFLHSRMLNTWNTFKYFVIEPVYLLYTRRNCRIRNRCILFWNQIIVLDLWIGSLHTLSMNLSELCKEWMNEWMFQSNLWTMEHELILNWEKILRMWSTSIKEPFILQPGLMELFTLFCDISNGCNGEKVVSEKGELKKSWMPFTFLHEFQCSFKVNHCKESALMFSFSLFFNNNFKWIMKEVENLYHVGRRGPS